MIRIYCINFDHVRPDTYSTMEIALTMAKTLGFECRLDRWNGERWLPIATWSPIYGTRIYGNDPVKHERINDDNDSP